MARDSYIPEIGTVSQTERMFRVNWLANVKLTPSGVPFVTADFVAKQGRRVRIIDIRKPEELVGALGYLPGSDWIPLSRIESLVERCKTDDPIIIISGGEERAHDATATLVKLGMSYAAFMSGGIMSWRDLGYSTTRDASILDREDVLREISDATQEPTSNITVEQVQRHVGDRLSVKWIKLPALLVRGLISCVDGRDDSGVIGSPGGDVGELLIGLRALERLTRRELSSAEVGTLLGRRLDVFGRFYMHTDVSASNSTITALHGDKRFESVLQNIQDPLEWRRFFAQPPREVQDSLLPHLLNPAHVGCGHLRLELTRPKEYETREGLVQSVLRSFHQKRWRGAPEMEYVPLAGGHTERAVLNVRIGGPLQPFSRIPLVSPAVGGAQVFVHHPRITSYLRSQLSKFLALQTDIVSGVDPEELHVEMERLGAVQLGRTLTELAKGLPIYDVVFHGEERVEVRFGGNVGE